MIDNLISNINLVSGENISGGDNLYYHIDDVMASDTKIGLYWATPNGDKWTLIKGPMFIKEIPAGTVAGNYGPINITDSDIGEKPNDSSLIIVVNSNLPNIINKTSLVLGTMYDNNPGHASLVFVSFDDDRMITSVNYDLGSLIVIGIIVTLSMLAIWSARNLD